MASFGSLQRAQATSQTMAEIDRTHERLKQADLATQPGEVVSFRDADNNERKTFPAHLMRKEPEEAERLEMIKKATGDNAVFAKPQLDDRTVSYFQRKIKDAEFLDREKFIAERFDLSNPAQAAWFNRIMPSYLQRRQDFGYAKLGMQKQLFDIGLRGPQSEEDIDFLYAIETGKLNLKELERPIWKVPEEGEEGTLRESYTKGLMPLESLWTKQENGEAQGNLEQLGSQVYARQRFGDAGRVPFDADFGQLSAKMRGN